MSPALDRKAIAERIRAFIGEQHLGVIEETAERLGVPDVSLRLSIDERAPHPTLDVIAAVVSVYGVDPCWLIYGEYCLATHHAALEKGPHVTPSELLDIVSSHRGQVDDFDSMRPDLRLQA
jgi:hypothetical protein